MLCGAQPKTARQGTKSPTRRLAAAAQAKDIPLGALGMDNTSARACLTPQERRGPRPRSGPPTADTGLTSPQTARSTTTTSNFGTAVNSNIVPIFSTGRLAQGNPHLEPHMRATARAKQQQKQRETPKGTYHVHQCARRRRAAILTMLPRGPVDRPGRVITLRGGLGHARVSI